MSEPVAEIGVDPAALEPAERLRYAAFRLFSHLLWQPPETAFLKSVAEAGLVDELVELASAGAPRAEAGLRSMRDWFVAQRGTGAGAFAAGRDDYLRLFVSTPRLPAPPWESAYRTQGRLVNQGPAQQVLLAYAEARLGFEGMKDIPADHIALELAFVAALIGEAARTGDALWVERRRRFEAEHMEPWVAAFCRDLSGDASTPLYSGLAAALPALAARPP